MASNRRDFLRNSLLGAGIVSTGLTSLITVPEAVTASESKKSPGPQRFNMSGFAAPKLDKVRIGIIGLGQRGPGAVDRLSFIEGVEIRALCDQYEDRVEKAQKILTDKGFPRAEGYSGSKEAWKKLCERNDLDLVYTCTPWALHTPIAVYAMEQGKHACTEVPAGGTIDELWQLVETSEKTKKHCMMLENCCYDFFELMTLNMARQGYFGEIIHGEGAYLHDLYTGYMYNKKGYAEMWRLKENYKNGNLYPTHGLGPVCQIMNINRGDQMDYLVSMQTADFMMAARASQLAATDDFFKEFAGKSFRGNMSNTVVRTHLGRTILVQHDVTSPRPYSRLHTIVGTKAFAQKYPDPPRISKDDKILDEKQMKDLENTFTPEIVTKVGEMAKKIGGHGGMDFLMDWRLIDCLRNGLPLDQDVYDAATWSSISPLSQQSVANRSAALDVPDFTRGSWKTNRPVELTLKGGGTTGVVKLK